MKKPSYNATLVSCDMSTICPTASVFEIRRANRELVATISFKLIDDYTTATECRAERANIINDIELIADFHNLVVDKFNENHELYSDVFIDEDGDSLELELHTYAIN